MSGIMAAASIFPCCETRRAEHVVEPHPPVKELEKLFAQGKGSLRHVWTRVQGLKIHALTSRGSVTHERPAIVLVHGSALSGRYMIPTAMELVNDFRIFVPDLPGFGESDKPAKILDVPELADWLAAWISALELAPVILVGNSFGCQVIADLAAAYPDKIAAAILQGPTTPPEERSWFWQFVRWRQNQRYNPASLGSMTYEDYKKCGLSRMYGSFKSQLDDRIEDKAPHIPAPVLVIRGEHDPIANQRWCEQIAELCPLGRLEIIPDVAHTLCYTAPVELAARTRSFFSSVNSRGARPVRL